MQKRIIPVLIVLMSISLVGIIYIQYLWIQKNVNEKQALIDNNIHLAVANVEQQLNDHQTFSYFTSSSGEIDFSNLINISDTVHLFSDQQADTIEGIQVKIMRQIDHQIESNTQQIIIEENYNLIEEFDTIKNVLREHELDKIDHMINKVKIELLDGSEHRLDSTRLEKLLSEELISFQLGQIQNWGVYDLESSAYFIEPNKQFQPVYIIDLFSTDILHPKRYKLHLTLDNSNLIWNEIWTMIVLSLLFLGIIIVVFGYSIKLVIKHKKISQIKTDFMNNMTHEFKTPLASISLAADLILHPNATIDQNHIQKYVTIIQEEKNRLNFQVERILEVAALNKKALDIQTGPIDLNTIISEAIKNLSLLIEREKADINFQLKNEIHVIANSFHLQKVIINLIENGIKYSDETAKINITIEEENDSAIISIGDEGIGMNAHESSRAFDDFYRAQTGNLHDTKGFGLGLSYCKLVVEKMGGEIRLESQAMEGTIVSIKLKLG